MGQALKSVLEAFNAWTITLPGSILPSISKRFFYIPLYSPDGRTHAARCAQTFLTEIIANHVLLPALDSIANPVSAHFEFLHMRQTIHNSQLFGAPIATCA